MQQQQEYKLLHTVEKKRMNNMCLQNLRKSWLAFLLGWPLAFGYASVAQAAPLTIEADRVVADYAASSHLQSIDDGELAEVSGQALFNLSYLAPGEAKDKSGTLITGSQNSGVGFYKLGLEGVLELNTNIRKLQLGCGGVNGAGVCDIDIDNLSLSGCGSSGCSNATSRADRVGSDAKLTNPFLQLAIKNPNNPATREMVGFRLSAEMAEGLLTIGTENSSTPTGINTMSGYMKVQSDSSGLIKGAAYTDATYFPAGSYPVTGTLTVIGGLGGTASFITTGGGFWIPALTNQAFTAPGLTVNDRRVTGVGLSTSLAIPPIYLDASYTTGGVYDAVNNRINTRGGPVSARVTSATGLASVLGLVGRTLTNAQIAGSFTGITANVTFTEDLKYIHYLPISSPFSLSMQGQDVHWPGANNDDIAKRGWWMSFADPVNIGTVNPADPVNIVPLFPQIAAALTPMNGSVGWDVLGALFDSGAQFDVNIGSKSLAAYPLSLPLSNLVLAGQDFNPNCWGTSKFC